MRSVIFSNVTLVSFSVIDDYIFSVYGDAVADVVISRTGAEDPPVWGSFFIFQRLLVWKLMVYCESQMDENCVLHIKEVIT